MNNNVFYFVAPPSPVLKKNIIHEIIHEIFPFFFFNKKIRKSITDILRKHQKTPYIKKNSWGGTYPPANTIG